MRKQEDDIKYIVDYLSSDYTSNRSSYGYDLYLPHVMEKWCDENQDANDNINRKSSYPCIQEISPYFYEAAWELCRIGVLRPGVRSNGGQSTTDGSAGNGYSITSFGRQWLSETDKDSFVPTEPGRFSEMLLPYAKKFGAGFQERANQAIRCYGAHAYLACCVMCGASAESILLHLAIKKEGEQEKILKLYKASNGRKKIKDIVVGKQKQRIKDEFERCFGLLQYWRDEAAHGTKSNIKENESYTSLALLLRLAQFAKDNYNILTRK